MTSGQEICQRVLWGFLVMLFLTTAAQANTLTKLRVVESDSSAQLIFSFSQPPSYDVIAELEDQRLVIRLSRTAAQSEYSLQPFTGAVIQDLAIYVDDHPSGADESAGDLRIEVLLKTAAVMVSHQALHKPSGLMLNIRQTIPASKTGAGTPSRKATQTVKPRQPTIVSPRPLPSLGVAAAPDSGPSPSAALPLASEPTALEIPQADHTDVSVIQPSIDKPGFSTLSEKDQTVPTVPPTMPALPATEEMRNLTGSGTSDEALAFLDLYFHRPAAFAANPSLLWSVAAAYVDLGLYKQGDALYQTIAERMDNPTLQAAAVLKRGRIALHQGELTNAERFLREFVDTVRHGALVAEAHETLGDALMGQEKFAAAAEAYGIALEHTPGAYKPLYMLYKLGWAQRKAGEWLKAAEVFRQAVDQLGLEPTETPGAGRLVVSPVLVKDLFQQLGDSLYKTQQYPEAVAAYRHVLEQSPTAWQTGWTLYHLGKSYEALERDSEATLTYQELARQVDAVWSEMGQQALTTLRWRAR